MTPTRTDLLKRARAVLMSGALQPPAADDVFVGDGDYLAIAAEFLDYFVEIGGLERHHAVLDIGCGIGRMAAGLACYLDPLTGRYCGFDPVAKGIAWCKRAFAAYPHFRFDEADVFNEHYRPDGRLLSTEYRFPPGDWSVDFAIATSIFTHLYHEEVEAYLREAARVLKPEGRLFSTFLLYDGDCPQRRPELPHLDFSVRNALRPNVWHVKDRPPLSAVAYKASDVIDLIRQATGRRAKVLPGRWRGGAGPFFQDVVLA